MEITQFTYFQQVGGLDCRPVTGEITYGLERLAMYLQGVESIYDIVWTEGPSGTRHLRRRVSPERGRAVGLQLRARRHRGAARGSSMSTSAPAGAAGGQAGAARLRAGAQGLAHLQSAGRAARHLRHRAAALHPAGAHARRAASPRPTTRAARRSAFRCSRARRRLRRRTDERARDFLFELGTEELPPRALLQRCARRSPGDRQGPGRGAACTRQGALVSPRRGASRVLVCAPAPSRRRASRSSAAGRRCGRVRCRGGADPCRAQPSPRIAARRDASWSGWTEGKGTLLFFAAPSRRARRRAAARRSCRRPRALPIPRRMHWGAGSAQFVRPVHWVVMLYGEEVVPATLLDTRPGHSPAATASTRRSPCAQSATLLRAHAA